MVILKKLLKARPFLITGIFFLILTIVSYLIIGKENSFVTITFTLAYLVFLTWVFIYLPFKFLKNLKNNKFELKNFFRLLTWIILVGTPILFGYYMYNGYKEAEINSGIKKSQEKYLNQVRNYTNFSLREAKLLSLKLYLIDSCEGGEEKINRMRDFDSNAEVYICMDLLKKNIRKENFPRFKNQLEKFNYTNSLQFHDEIFQEYIKFLK